MDWKPGGNSDDIEDRRDQSGGGGGGGGGIGGIHLGIGGMIIVGILSLVFHQNFFALISGGGGDSGPSPSPAPSSMRGNLPNRVPSTTEKPEVDFVTFVLNDVQATWTKILPAQGNRPYRHAKLVLFRDETASGCGAAEAATGPFYCPGDEKVYLDLGFFDELKRKFAAPGEFAQAYVIAHEIGHHIQKIIGIEPKMRHLQEQNPRSGNALSVRLELQADCFAGVWGKSTEERKIVNEQDVEAGLRAAASVGDDRIQQMSGRRVSPESFTHGSAAQRTAWFKKGLAEGQISACNTFEGLAGFGN
jgi:predicted metalloprotease